MTSAVKAVVAPDSSKRKTSTGRPQRSFDAAGRSCLIMSERPSARPPGQRDLRHIALGCVRQLEIFARPEAEGPGDQVAGKRLHQNILISHRPVVVTARHL